MANYENTKNANAKTTKWCAQQQKRYMNYCRIYDKNDQNTAGTQNDTTSPGAIRLKPTVRRPPVSNDDTAQSAPTICGVCIPGFVARERLLVWFGFPATDAKIFAELGRGTTRVLRSNFFLSVGFAYLMKLGKPQCGQ